MKDDITTLINENIRNTNAILKRLDNLKISIEDFQTTYENSQKKEESKGYEVIQSVAIMDAVMEVREYNSSYVGDINLAMGIKSAQDLGMKLRQLVVTLKGGTLAYESNQFLASEGQLELGKLKISPKDIFQGAVRKMNDETFFRPTLTGQGAVTLDSSFKFLHLMRIKKPTRIVLEKGIYLASVGAFEFKTTANMNLGYMMFSGKNIVQTDVRGAGILALELPVAFNELQEVRVTYDNPLKVNGDYVLMWAGDLDRKVATAGKIMGSIASGTGLVETYTCRSADREGIVWLAPTLGYYKQLAKDLEGKGYGEDRTEAIEDETQAGKSKISFLKRLFLNH